MDRVLQSKEHISSKKDGYSMNLFQIEKNRGNVLRKAHYDLNPETMTMGVGTLRSAQFGKEQ